MDLHHWTRRSGFTVRHVCLIFTIEAGKELTGDVYFFWLSYYYALLIPKSFDNTNIRPFIPVWYPLDPRFIPDSSPIWSRRENQGLIDDQHGIMHTLVQWYLRNQGRPALLVPCSHHRCTIILSDWLLIIKTGSGQALVCINRLGSPDKSIFNIGH